MKLMILGLFTLLNAALWGQYNFGVSLILLFFGVIPTITGFIMEAEGYGGRDHLK